MSVVTDEQAQEENGRLFSFVFIKFSDVHLYDMHLKWRPLRQGQEQSAGGTMSDTASCHLKKMRLMNLKDM